MGIAVIAAQLFVVALIVAWLQSFPGFGSLQGKTWQWTQLQVTELGWNGETTMDVPDPGRYTIVFNTDGTAVLTADCNRSPWTYRTSGRSISLQSHATEWSTCGADSLAQTLVDVLSPSYTHSVGFGTLALEGHRGDGLFYGEKYRLTFKAQ